MVFHTLVGNAVAGFPRQVAIVGAKGLVQVGRKDGTSPSTTQMIKQVLDSALQEARLSMRDIDGLIAVPSLKEDHFMEAHYQATCLGMFSDKIEEDRPLRCRTIDTGGAGPVSALLEGVRMIQHEALECVAVVAADCVGSMDTNSFLERADDIWIKYAQQMKQQGTVTDDFVIPSPAIPHGYDAVTSYQMEAFGITRDQLRMAVTLLSFHAGLNTDSLFHRKHHQAQAAPGNYSYTTLQEVQDSPAVTPHLSLLECARRADGAACLLLASNRFLRRKGMYPGRGGLPVVIGGGESSGPLYPPQPMNETLFSCDEAMSYAYADAGNLTAHDIDFFGLYDCFPICLVRALEAAGVCGKGNGGAYLEEHYDRLMAAMEQQQQQQQPHGPSAVDKLLRDPTFFPVNTHGGLLCYGAPWEVPAMYNIIEAVHQLRGTAKGRQLDNCRRALIYGNGGIFSASSVAILAKSLEC